MDETLTGLKGELERCLLNYKSKRAQVEQLQTELKETKTELETVSNKVGHSEKELSNAKV